MAPAVTTLRTLRACLSVVLCAAALSAIVGCGAGGEGGAANHETASAERLCRAYRQAVTNVRVDAPERRKAEDFDAAANAARAAAQGTGPGDLSAHGREYLASLRTIASAYDRAAAALREGRGGAYFSALDTAEPIDDRIDGLARLGGLGRCALGAIAQDESGVSQSGFPAMAVPADYTAYPPNDDGGIVYVLDHDEALFLDRGFKLRSGTAPTDDVAKRFEEGIQLKSLTPIERSGNPLVPMRGYRYDTGRTRGIVHVFSGQGYTWDLRCASQLRDGPSRRLERACERAVQTLGFLMF